MPRATSACRLQPCPPRCIRAAAPGVSSQAPLEQGH
eukprot:CAMPEP_0197931880 /NCGR_PEP_ID=MMETSP1439-20131203/107780_1 /TAXON_ID=66791 /ORGANISM="Gonyaulax spinifera, Strain CCMP409" /LENGTH=35 /DNA_ID= /DNA_START= /DNA_END= /DNA_ORIENTATION=